MSIKEQHLQEQLEFEKQEYQRVWDENLALLDKNDKLKDELLNLYRRLDDKRTPDDRDEQEDGSYADLEHQVHTLVFDKLKLEDTVQALQIRLARFTEASS